MEISKLQTVLPSSFHRCFTGALVVARTFYFIVHHVGRYWFVLFFLQTALGFYKTVPPVMRVQSFKRFYLGNFGATLHFSCPGRGPDFRRWRRAWRRARSCSTTRGTSSKSSGSMVSNRNMSWSCSGSFPFSCHRGRKSSELPLYFFHFCGSESGFRLCDHIKSWIFTVVLEKLQLLVFCSSHIVGCSFSYSERGCRSLFRMSGFVKKPK